LSSLGMGLKLGQEFATASPTIRVSWRQVTDATLLHLMSAL
jgi:hypothetical protein